ncbi:MAG: tryptophan halogenase family protein [Wenzhouxiangellaceae bacterium]|nr:tryptophan halogenase family protein [Wenzhouxiangellaceae bacterium]
MPSGDDNAIRDVVVVGGGTAGWLTAGLVAAEQVGRDPETRVSVTLVESPQIATIGVGEGTWPTMRSTLERLGIPEALFLERCTAAFKQGTRFVGWVDGSDGDTYYHPFTAPAGYPSVDLASHWWRDRRNLSFVDAVSPQGMVCDRRLAPKQAHTPQYAGVVNYGYHLDAGRFAELLTEHCTRELDVRHVQDRIIGVEADDGGDIAAVRTEASGAIRGDLFVDCSGMRSMLLAGHYGVGFVDRSGALFNDTALAIQVPYADENAPVASQTISTAQSAGWIWDIGLPSRRGIGHVYSSRHCSDDEAHDALARYLESTGAPPDPERSPRKISFKPGHREKFWHRNCVAVGMAAGFIEPLEASALVMVELSARMIAEEMPAERGLMDIVARRFNERFGYRWDRIIDFLKLHYLLSRRDDSDYWAENRSPETVPDSLLELMALWRFRPPTPADLPRHDEIFSAASYQYVLYGMGFEPDRMDPAGTGVAAERARRRFDDNIRAANQLLARLPAHRDLLERIARDGLPAAG